VVTTNARDSRPRENLGRQSRSNENYVPKTSRQNGSNKGASVQEKRESKPTGRTSFGGNSLGGKSPDGKSLKGVGGKFGKTGGYNKNRDFKSNPFNKDDDYENDKNYGRGNQRTESRSKSGQTKEREQQPDKFETLKRLENEKKIKQKKLDQEFGSKSEKPNKPLVKHRRTNNIDWTKGYEKGLFDDDDEIYTEYL